MCGSLLAMLYMKSLRGEAQDVILKFISNALGASGAAGYLPSAMIFDSSEDMWAATLEELSSAKATLWRRHRRPPPSSSYSFGSTPVVDGFPTGNGNRCPAPPVADGSGNVYVFSYTGGTTVRIPSRLPARLRQPHLLPPAIWAAAIRWCSMARATSSPLRTIKAAAPPPARISTNLQPPAFRSSPCRRVPRHQQRGAPDPHRGFQLWWVGSRHQRGHGCLRQPLGPEQ